MEAFLFKHADSLLPDEQPYALQTAGSLLLTPLDDVFAEYGEHDDEHIDTNAISVSHGLWSVSKMAYASPMATYSHPGATTTLPTRPLSSRTKHY